MSHSDWLSNVFKPSELRKAARGIAKQIKFDRANGIHINAIAVTGLSGLTFGTVLSYMTGLRLIALRKTDYSHSSYTIEYDDYRIGYAYCIVDDLIASGDTMNRIIRNMTGENDAFHCEKIYLYHPSSSSDVFIDDTGNKIPVYPYPG